MFLSFSIHTSLLPVVDQPALDSDGDVIMVTPEQAAARVETRLFVMWTDARQQGV
jgi:hypothetical protein